MMLLNFWKKNSFKQQQQKYLLEQIELNAELIKQIKAQSKQKGEALLTTPTGLAASFAVGVMGHQACKRQTLSEKSLPFSWLKIASLLSLPATQVK
ncbi:hypothetical protein [Aliikangiella sp. IMCC44632]